MVDGTTIYFNDPPPKINEAPSLDNTTPEAISPTVSLSQAAQPTESTGAPEIESSVREEADLDLTSMHHHGLTLAYHYRLHWYNISRR